VHLGDETFDVTVATIGNDLVVTSADGTVTPVRSDWRPGEPVWTGTVGEASVAIQVRSVLNGVFLQHAGAAANARVYTRREAELAALMPIKETGDSGKQLLCPMPGLVKQILVEEGQEVKVGEPLAIVEAMKMENVLRAERDGKIATIAAKSPLTSVRVIGALWMGCLFRRTSGASVCSLAGIDSVSPTAVAFVHDVDALTTSRSTWRQVKRSDVLGSSAPGSNPASHSTWKPLQMPRTRPPLRANRSTSIR
jgi:biotin carboxyl carrier protein